MNIACIIRYEIDPFQREEFKQYAERWLAVIPQCGGTVLGYFLPHEGTNNVAFGVLSFPSMAEYEAYRTRLKSDGNGKANFEFAQERKLILREERSFLEIVEARS